MLDQDNSPPLAGPANTLGEALMLFALVAPTSAAIGWLLTYSAIEAVRSTPTLNYPDAALASIQYLLWQIDSYLPAHQIGQLPWIPIWPEIEKFLSARTIGLVSLKTSAWVGLACMFFSAPVTFILVLSPSPSRVFLRGTRITRDPRAIERALNKSPNGIRIHSGVRLSRERETKHMLLIGSTGSGKSQIINSLIDEILQGNEPAIIYDHKGDLTQYYYSRGVALLAPWDSRSAKIAIGRDVKNEGHARTLANSIIPQSKDDPMWGAAARSIATAIFLDCIACSDRRIGWQWKDAISRLDGGQTALVDLVRRYAPANADLIAERDSRTVQSILTTLSAHFDAIRILAKADRHISDKRSISLHHWLDTGHPRLIILQGNKEMSALSDVLQSTIFRLLLARIASPELPDSRTRIRWFIGDEFLQLGKAPELPALLQTARSKGVRMVLGAQDVPGIKSVYEQHAGDALLGAAATTIGLQTQCAVTRKWISALAGEQTIAYRDVSHSRQRSEDSSSQRWVEQTRPTLSPEAVGATLGQQRARGKPVTRGAILGGRDVVGVLDWPRVSRRVIAEAHCPAEWLAGERPAGAPRPVKAIQEKPASETSRGNSTPGRPSKRRMRVRAVNRTRSHDVDQSDQ